MALVRTTGPARRSAEGSSGRKQGDGATWPQSSLDGALTSRRYQTGARRRRPPPSPGCWSRRVP
eukprot:13952562-Heterocapsa_arctica.AAC.1